MTQEEKQLLLKDLCGRLPYGVKVTDGLHTITLKVRIDTAPATLAQFMQSENLRYYLRPLSSMTEEEKEELKEEHKKDERIYVEVIERIANGDKHARGTAVPHFAVDWCNKHHFDYRGLIEKGLAKEAPEGMFKLDKENK